MHHAVPELRLRIDAMFAQGHSLYVLALEGLSIVAALRELSWQLAIPRSQSFLDEQEYAAVLVEILCPMAGSVRLLPPGAAWSSHVTLRLHTETRQIEGSEEVEEVIVVAIAVDEIECTHTRLGALSSSDRGRLMAAYDEETSIIRSLDGFVGDASKLLARLRLQMDHGATLAHAQLQHRTVDRAQLALHCLFATDRKTRKRIEEIAAWLRDLQRDQDDQDQSFARTMAAAHSMRKH